MSVNIGPGIVTNGLVVYYDFANRKSYPGSGNVVYNLAQGYSNITASLSGSGASIPTLVSNTYLSFNKSNDNYMYYTLPSMDPSFTSMIIASSPTSNWTATIIPSTLVDGVTPSTPISAYRLVVGNTGGIWGVMRTSVGTYGDTSNTITPSSITTPHYYYCSFNNTTGATIYGADSNINYSETLSTTNRGTGINTSFYFSRFNPYYSGFAGSRFLDSNIYYYMYYNRALSVDEIKQNYNAVKLRYNLF